PRRLLSDTRATVFVQIAPPPRSLRVELDRRLVFGELDRAEGQRRCRVLLAGGLRQRSRQPAVIEGGSAAEETGVDQNEFVPAGHRHPVPEAIGVADPVRLLGDADGQAGEPLPYGGRAAVVFGRPLRPCHSRPEHGPCCGCRDRTESRGRCGHGAPPVGRGWAGAVEPRALLQLDTVVSRTFILYPTLKRTASGVCARATP